MAFMKLGDGMKIGHVASRCARMGVVPIWQVPRLCLHSLNPTLQSYGGAIAHNLAIRRVRVMHRPLSAEDEVSLCLDAIDEFNTCISGLIKVIPCTLEQR